MPSKRRIARSLVTLLALSSINFTSAIFFTAPSSIAYTQGTATAGTSYGGTGGSLNAANQNCTNGAVVAIGATKSGSNLNSFMFVCKGFNNDGTPSGTEAVTNVFNSPSESDRCQTGQIGIGIRAIASNGGTLIGGVGLICGKPWLQTTQDVRDIKPDALSAGTVYTYTCPDGQLLAGFYLRTGALVDQITPKCSTFTGFVFSAVGSPTIVSSGPHTASISFTGPTAGLSNPALTYTVTAVPASGPTVTAIGLTSPISLTGLASYMSYTITVTGANTFGNSTSTGNAALSSAPLPENETDTALTMTQSGDAATEYAYVAHSANLVLTDSLTIEAWVRPTSFNSGGWSMVVNKETSYELGITSSSGSGIGYWSYGLRGSGWNGITTDVRVVLNEWHHIALTRMAGENSVKFYLDGQLAYTGSADGAGTGSVTDQSNPLTIGARWGSGTGYQAQFTGQIDHVAIFSTARTQANIKSDMKTYGLRNQPGLKAYFDFNENAGSVVYNRISGAPAITDLTLVGSNLFTDVKIVETSTVVNYTLTKFPRTYLNSVGGWKPPADITKISVLIVGGGGGGGGGYQGGGGGAGGFLESTVAINPNSNYEVIVGTGGQGAKNPTFPTNGENSSAFTMTAIGGGAGMSELTVSGSNQQSDAQPGGSGGGASHGTNRTGGSGTAGQGNAGANGPDIYPTCSEFAGGGGGGAGSAGLIAVCSDPNVSNVNHGGYGGSPKLSYVTNKYYAGGGGGSLRGANGTALKRGKGGNGDATTAGDGAYSADVALGATGSATSAPANSGGGGGAGSSVDGTKGYGGNGGSGFVAVRWITAKVPSYSKPTNAYLNVGMTETFTTNVLVDSATANLTRTFKWESTTPTSNGAFTLIKQGTGAANAAFSWIPSDTSTSGAGYLYRLTVTDSDTAGLFITDSSTAYAVINRSLSVSGNSGIAKTINVSKSETFTITSGTSTYRTTLTNNNPGITLDTSTAISPIVRISETMTVGTYYETLTVVDSVSASVITPLTIVVAAPPNLLNTGEIVNSGLLFNLEAGNSASIIGESGTAITSANLKDISGFKKNGQTGTGSTATLFEDQSCKAPTYSRENGGTLNFNGSDQCIYVPYLETSTSRSLTIETWVKVPSTGFVTGSAIFTQNDANSSSDINFTLGALGSSNANMRFGYRTGSSFTYFTDTITLTLNSWMHIVGTVDASYISLYVDGVLKSQVNSGGSVNSTAGYYIGAGFTSGKFFKGSIASVRVYKRALTAGEIQNNYDATKYRFLAANQNVGLIDPTQQYGTSTTESFTATSGLGTRTLAYVTGDKPGLSYTTSGAITTLRMGESLTATTHYETITVTDSLGASTYLPIKITISKADTLTISMDTATTVVYNAAPIAIYPKPYFKGLAGVDSLTVSTLFTSPTYLDSATVPTDVDTYTVIAANPIFSVGALSNYVNVIYETSTARVNQANQNKLSINLYGAVAGTPFLIQTFGGSGDGAVTESVTAGSTATGCAVSNHVLSNTSPSTQQLTCNILVTKAASKNYKVETLTATVYFMLYVNNMPTNQVGGGTNIALNGANSVWVDPGEAPTITGFNILGSCTPLCSSRIEISGTGFGDGSNTSTYVKFWRNKVVALGSGSSGAYVARPDLIVIAGQLIPSGITAGPLTVVTQYGTAVSADPYIP